MNDGSAPRFGDAVRLRRAGRINDISEWDDELWASVEIRDDEGEVVLRFAAPLNELSREEER